MLRWLLPISLPLYVLDQVTKLWVLRRFPPPDEFGHGEEIPVIDGFFWLHRLHNTGVAFGKFNGGAYSNWIFGGISAVAFIAITVLWHKDAFPTRLGKLAAVLLLSGIAGNLTDRLAHGYVVDFLQFRLGPLYAKISGSEFFPSFNVADSCICVAAALLFITAWQTPNPAKKLADNAAERQI